MPLHLLRIYPVAIGGTRLKTGQINPVHGVFGFEPVVYSEMLGALPVIKMAHIIGRQFDPTDSGFVGGPQDVYARGIERLDIGAVRNGKTLLSRRRNG